MNTISSLKLIALFSRLALVGLAGFVLSLTLEVQPLALFSFAVGALVLLIAAGDYAPRSQLRRSRIAGVIDFASDPLRSTSPEKLAA